LQVWDHRGHSQRQAAGRRQLSHWAKETGRGCLLGMPCMARKLRRKNL